MSESLTYYLIIFVAIILHNILLMIPFLRHTYPGTSDNYFHLQKVVKKYSGFERDNLIINDYPWLFHSIIGTISNKFKRFSAESMIRFGIFLGILNSIIIPTFFLTFFDLKDATFAICLTLLTNFYIFEEVIFSPRGLSVLFFYCFIFTYFLEYPLNLISIFFISLIIITQSTTFQTLLYLCIISSIFLELQIIIYFCLGFLIDLLIFRTRLVKMLKTHFERLYYFITKKTFKGGKITGIHGSRNKLLFFIYFPTSVIAIILIMMNFFPQIFSFLGIYISPFYCSGSKINNFLVLAIISIFLLATFWFFGDDYRYLLYINPFCCLFFVKFTIFNGLFIFLIPLILLYQIVTTLYFQLRLEYLNEDILNLINYLNQIGEKKIILFNKNIKNGLKNLRAVVFFTDCETLIEVEDTVKLETLDIIKKIDEKTQKLYLIYEKNSRLSTIQKDIKSKRFNKYFLLDLTKFCSKVN
ncbi:MAG: hypothetical protein ACTSRG_07155 [Candidatus Helarchaeota archaeon]